jgi:hypothetical protein
VNKSICDLTLKDNTSGSGFFAIKFEQATGLLITEGFEFEHPIVDFESIRA